MAIEGVAVRFQHEGGEVEVRLPKPNRHCDCFKYAADVLGLPLGSHTGSENQGFYDSIGRYHDRKDAMIQVKMTGQKMIPDWQTGKVNTSIALFSEDVW